MSASAGSGHERWSSLAESRPCDCCKPVGNLRACFLSEVSRPAGGACSGAFQVWGRVPIGGVNFVDDDAKPPTTSFLKLQEERDRTGRTPGTTRQDQWLTP